MTRVNLKFKKKFVLKINGQITWNNYFIERRVLFSNEGSTMINFYRYIKSSQNVCMDSQRYGSILLYILMLPVKTNVSNISRQFCVNFVQTIIKFDR